MESNQETIEIDIKSFHLPRWEELPSIDLYLDQVVTLIETYLNNYMGSEQNKIITKTMINNYVKQEIIKPPDKKKYDKSHLAQLFIICILKQLYSINDIDTLLKLFTQSVDISIAYNKFCCYLEDSIALVFENKEFSGDNKISEDDCLLWHVVLSFANHLYVKRRL